MPDQGTLKRMREIMRRLDEVSRTAQELREQVQLQMESARARDARADDDPDVTRARRNAKQAR